MGSYEDYDMTIFATIVILVVLTYASISLLLWYGTYLTSPLPAPPQTEKLPRVRVLLAARNEEQRLAACLESLLRSDYPQNKTQIIIVNDRSTDRTQQIAEEFARNDERVRVLAVTQRLPDMSGKASALSQGMQLARGEIILMTDADCMVPPHWVRAMVAHFTPEVGLVGGFTLLSPSPALQVLLPASHRDGLFAKIQTLDWMYLLTVGAGAAGLGKPVSILGNNFGFRREAYEQVGGYEKLGFSIIEDFALMRKIVQETHWRVSFPLDAATTIFSFPSPTWREYFDQRVRWAAGGKEVGWFAKLLMSVAFLAHVTVVLAASISPLLALAGLLTILLVDGALLWRCATTLQYKALLKYLPLFEIYFLLYSLVLAATVIFPTTVQWKGRRYRWNLRGQIKSVEE